MAGRHESTARMGMDITELKAGIQEARRQIRLINSEFERSTAGIGEAILNYLGQLPGMVWDSLTLTIQKFIDFGGEAVSQGASAASGFLNNVVTYIAELPGNVWSHLTQAISKVAEWAGQLKDKGIESAKALVKSVTDGVKDLPKKMYQTGKDIVDGVWDGICKAKDKFKENIKDFFGNIADTAKEKLKINSPSKVMREEVGQQITAGVAEGISDRQGDVDDSMDRLTSGVMSPAEQMTKDMGREATAAGTAMVQNLGNLLSTIPDMMGKLVKSALGALEQFSRQMGIVATNAARAFSDAMIQGIRAMQSAMNASGRSLVEGLWQGISGASGWLHGQVAKFASGIVNKLKNSLGIHSPSRVMRDEIGKNLSLGIGEGISRNAKAVHGAMQCMLKKLAADVESAKIQVGAAAAGVTQKGAGAIQGDVGSFVQEKAGNTYNFYQTNNSPKALSRLDIYRQSKNALRYAANVGR